MFSQDRLVNNTVGAVLGLCLATAVTYAATLLAFRLGYWPGAFSDGGSSIWTMSLITGWPCALDLEPRRMRFVVGMNAVAVAVLFAVYYAVLGMVLLRDMQPVLIVIVPVAATAMFLVPWVRGWVERRLGDAQSR